MNRKTAIFLASLMIAAASSAQSLAMPDGDSSREETPVAGQTETPSPQRKAEHNTPSQSYKAERNAIRKGNSLFNEKKYHEALEEYEKALDVNAGSIRGRYNKAVTLLELQSEDNKGTENDPRVIACGIFAEIIPDAKNYDIEIAEKALYNLGNVAFNDQQYDQSIEMYKSALRINPDNLQTRENLRLAPLK
ncbi:MAG: tetratricopeptide repeat protein, partial [Muribaculaceae bacterium]|nr:tetratricopeptide repeat protein [Muribaculaceae bacterium]